MKEEDSWKSVFYEFKGFWGFQTNHSLAFLVAYREC